MTDVNELCARISNEPNAKNHSRLIAGLSSFDEAKVFRAYGENIMRVYVGDNLTNCGFVRMPSVLFSSLETLFKRAFERDEIPILLGLDGYLSLLTPEGRRECFSCIKDFFTKAECGSLVVCLRWNWDEINSVFSHPSDKDFYFFSVSFSKPPEVPVTLIHQPFVGRFGEILKIPYLKDWVNHSCGDDTSEQRVAFAFSGHTVAGINAEVRQVFTKEDFLKICCGFDSAGMYKDFGEWIFDNTNGVEIEDGLSQIFYDGKLERMTQIVLHKFFEITDDAKRDVFLLFTAAHAPHDSYLKSVITRFVAELREGVKIGKDFRDAYVSPTDEEINSPNAVHFAEERKVAMRTGLEPNDLDLLQESFLKSACNVADEKLAVWANVGISAEELLWVSRAKEGSTIALQKSYYLKAYLSNVSTGNTNLDDYFKEYREIKVANKISEGFVARAFESSLPELALQHRAKKVYEVKSNSKAALLVVDGLGAEWIPFIVKRADRYQMKIESVDCSYGNLPTSTKVNDVFAEFGSTEEYRFEKMNDLDDVYHTDGLSDEESFYREMEVIDRKILKEVKKLLASYENVYVTADHGSSRLAVLAYRQKLSGEGIKFTSEQEAEGCEIKDWRYAKVPQDYNPSNESLVKDIDGNYLCIKGYRRFSYQGGAKYERHGGATIEERVIPFVKFGRNFTNAYIASSLVVDYTKQIEEDSDFDL